MARRLYLPSTGAAGLGSLAYGTGWNKTSQATRLAGSRTKSNTAYANRAMTSSALAPEFHCGVQYQFPNLAAQIISGTLKGQFLAVQNNADFDGTLAIAARVVSADGLTLRGTLTAPVAATDLTGEFNTGGITDKRSRRFRDASNSTNIPLTSITVQAGDVLVVEIGCRDNSTSTGSQANIEVGDLTADADLPEADTGSGPGVPWVEFSDNLLFVGETPPIQAAQNSFNAPTVTGTQTITGVGFQPKALIFFLSGLAADGEGPNAALMMGFATAPADQNAGNYIGEDNVYPSDINAANSITTCIRFVGADGVIKWEAALTALSADGFTLNWTTVQATPIVVSYLALAGGDIFNAHADHFLFQNALGNQTVTGLGFQPTGVLFWCPVNTAVVPNNTSKNCTGFIGFATVTSAGTVQQAYTSYRMTDGAGTITTRSRQRTDFCVGTLTNSGVASEASLVSFNADGFTINFVSASGEDAVFYLALRGPSVRVGAFNQPTVTGNQAVTAVGIEPSALMLASFNQVANTGLATHARMSFGVATGTTNRTSLWNGSRDARGSGSTPMWHRSALTRTKALTMYTEGSLTSTLNAEADLVSFDLNGFTLNWTTVDATAREILYFVIAPAPVLTTQSLAGVSSGVAALSGNLAQSVRLAGTITASAVAQGAMTPIWGLFSDILPNVQSTLAMAPIRNLESSIQSQTTVTGDPLIYGGELAASAGSASGMTAILGTSQNLVGSVEEEVEVGATLSARWPLAGGIAAAFLLDDREQPLQMTYSLRSNAVANSAVAGDFGRSDWMLAGNIAAASTGAVNLSGNFFLPPAPINAGMVIQEATLELPQFLSCNIAAFSSASMLPPEVVKFGGPATFEDFIKWPTRYDVLIAISEWGEILTRWAKELSYTRVYYVSFPTRVGQDDIEGGLHRTLERLEENGRPLTRVFNLADVDGLAGSYFYNETTGTLYAHAYQDVDESGTYTTPDALGLTMVAFFNLYFSSDGISLVIDGRLTPFFPIIVDDSFAKMTLEVEDPLFGVKRIPDGMVRLLNYNGFLSRFYQRYRWKNKRIEIMLGGSYNNFDLPFEEYKALGVYLVEDMAPDEDTSSFKLVGQQSALLKEVPVTVYTQEEFPNAGAGIWGSFKPLWYGLNTVKPDLVNGGEEDALIPGEYLLADPAFQTMFSVSSVQAVSRETGQTVGLASGTDFLYLSSANLLVITNPTYSHTTHEIVVTAYGKPTPDGSDYMHMFAEIVYDLVTTFTNMGSVDFDLDLACQCLQDNTDELGVYIKNPTTLLELLQNQQEEQPSLERSAMGVLDMLENGLWRLRIWSSSFNPATLPRLVKQDFQSFIPRTKLESVFYRVEVYYNYNYSRQEWQMTYAENPATRYGDGSEQILKVYTHLRRLDSAQRLAQRYRFLSSAIPLQVQCSEVGVKMINQRAGDKVSVSYLPAPSLDKEFSDELFEIEAIVQTFSKPPRVEFRLGNLRGIGRSIGFWTSPTTPRYEDATTGERSQSGFWSDTQGRPDPMDPSSENVSRWW